MYQPYQAALNGLSRQCFPTASDRNRAAVDGLKQHGNSLQRELGKMWDSDWCIFSLAANRVTGCHRDINSGRDGIDGLTPLGTFHGGEFNIPALGAILSYRGGSMVIIRGRNLHHEARRFHGGPRFVALHYTHESVLAVEDHRRK